MNSLDALQFRAKQALGTLSLIDHNTNWEHHYEPKTPINKRTVYTTRTIHTTRLKDRLSRIQSRKSSFSQPKTLLVPKKIKFQDHSVLQSLTKVRSNSQGKRKTIIRKMPQSESSSLNPSDPMPNPLEIENIDMMKYWCRHRSQKNSINGLVRRIREKRSVLRGCQF